jgi:predicted RNA-binding Zn ribbon-like protein
MDWVFDGGRPCLELVNTLRARHLAEPVELLTSPEALAEWLGLAGFTVGRTAVTGRNVTAAKALRESVNRLLTEPPPREPDVRLVNNAVKPPLPARLRLDDGALRREAPAPPDWVATAFGAIASDAVDLATSAVFVRICAADDCGLRFYDGSPLRTRQWCAMARCGNRAKARAHYARAQGRSR